MMSDDLKGCNAPGFLVVAISGVGHIPSKGKDEKEAAREGVKRLR